MTAVVIGHVFQNSRARRSSRESINETQVKVAEDNAQEKEINSIPQFQSWRTDGSGMRVTSEEQVASAGTHGLVDWSSARLGTEETCIDHKHSACAFTLDAGVVRGLRAQPVDAEHKVSPFRRAREKEGRQLP